jgi:hypothetical protein
MTALPSSGTCAFKAGSLPIRGAVRVPVWSRARDGCAAGAGPWRSGREPVADRSRSVACGNAIAEGNLTFSHRESEQRDQRES